MARGRAARLAAPAKIKTTSKMKIKNIIIGLCMALPVYCAGQVVTTYDYKKHPGGDQHIGRYICGEDTTYVLSLGSNNRFYGDVVVDLGSREEAVRMMRWLVDFVPDKGMKRRQSAVRLGNASDNTAVPVTVMGAKMYRIYTGTGAISGLVAKKQLRDFAEMLEGGKF